MDSSLYRNSIFLMVSSVATAGFGFIFWILNARLFSTHEIGIATTLASTIGFLSDFSLLGIKNGLIRFLPKSETPNNKINTGFNVVTIISILLAFLFLGIYTSHSSELTFINNNFSYIFLFTLYLTTFSLNQIQEGIFVAYRSTLHILIKNILGGVLKLVLPFLFISYGAFGIFSAFSLGGLISLFYGLYILNKYFKFQAKPIIDKLTIRQIGRFSLGDYAGLFLGSAPYFLLPLIIIHKLGAEEAAFYYIAMQIASILLIIPSAVNQSLFAEGSHNEEETKMHVLNSLKLSFMLLIPLIALIITFGGYILAIFGKHYSENGLGFLRLMAISGIFIGINQVGSALVHVEKRIKIYILLNLMSAIVITSMSFVLLPYGLIGIGWAFLTGYGLVTLIYSFILRESLR